MLSAMEIGKQVDTPTHKIEAADFFTIKLHQHRERFNASAGAWGSGRSNPGRACGKQCRGRFADAREQKDTSWRDRRPVSELIRPECLSELGASEPCSSRTALLSMCNLGRPIFYRAESTANAIGARAQVTSRPDRERAPRCARRKATPRKHCGVPGGPFFVASGPVAIFRGCAFDNLQNLAAFRGGPVGRISAPWSASSALVQHRARAFLEVVGHFGRVLLAHNFAQGASQKVRARPFHRCTPAAGGRGGDGGARPLGAARYRMQAGQAWRAEMDGRGCAA